MGALFDHIYDLREHLYEISGREPNYLLIGRYTLDELKNEQEWGEFIDRSAAPEVLGMKIRIDMENDFSVCVGCSDG